MNINLAKKQLVGRLERLESIALELTRKERLKSVDHILETYFDATGEHPKSDIIERLSNIILVEDIKDRKKNKTRTKEYPFLSDRQFSTRMKREYSLEDDTLDFLHQKEVKKMDSAFKKRTQNKED
ncbi:hypothetical protein MOC17_20720 [Bacillus haynesii]|uniref:hypothetical protein n=1 Tax=Bacillus haynesii TaxID=1925021 RepID=UPI0022801047|nr:hypothetical protein [Bacillus haynesii]MCY8048480.1 hypothetical protein [Bacillus haynesii]MCY9324043.1 hypothetical protein [Bacillus haynesii]